jgi:murein DD-endopeptidase MepM/ murein hydrolase activator NlpD
LPHSAVVAGRSRPRLKYAYVLGLTIAGLVSIPATAATPPTGGAQAGPTPKLRTLLCRTACAGVSVARAGSRIRVKGRALATVDSVVFQGLPGAADDVAVAPLRARRKYVDARVPRTAITGPVVVVSTNGAESAPSAVPLTIDAAAPPVTSGAGDSLGIDVEVQGNRVFYGAERAAQVSYLVRGSQAANVAVELIRLSDGVAITRWEPGLVAPETPQTVTWDGMAGGKVQRDGRYAFRVFAQSASGATASSSQVPTATAPATSAPGAFLFQRHIFPIRGAHTMGTGAAAFGGGRGHQGQDTFAKCGTRLVAARAGVVKFKQYHSRAGHYIVIDGDNEGYDYTYMHMRDASLVDQGDHVYTGQPIGFVGDTGHANGCHLHLEIWKAPGWYSGGSAVDPLPFLQAWDKTS